MVRAVDGVSFTITGARPWDWSGSRGVASPPSAESSSLSSPTSGEVLFEGKNVHPLAPTEMRRLRKEIQIIFQDPVCFPEPPHDRRTDHRRGPGLHQNSKERRRGNGSWSSSSRRNSGEHIPRYPHEFSGGQRQRIGVARALAVEPKLIVCDEPVSALDVSVQAQVLNLLQDLKRDFRLTYLFIAHDLAVVQHISDRIAVMYMGKIVEMADRDEIYSNPLHPYTHALLRSIPIPDPHVPFDYHVIQGDLPSPLNLPPGCRFHGRCDQTLPVCRQEEPPFREVRKDHWLACHL